MSAGVSHRIEPVGLLEKGLALPRRPLTLQG
jgi:hypothetical protein